MINFWCFPIKAVEGLDDVDQTPVTKKPKRTIITSTPILAAVSSTPISTFASIASSLKTLKTIKVEPFNMLKDDPGLWSGAFEKALENHGPVEDIAFATLFHLIDDSGQTWHFQYRRRNKIIIWPELKDEFVEFMQKRFVKKLGELKKQYVDDQSAEAYVQGQVNVHKSFFSKMSEKELILVAMAGLPEDFRLELTEYKDVKLSVFQSFCQFIDKANKVIADRDEEEQEKLFLI